MTQVIIAALTIAILVAILVYYSKTHIAVKLAFLPLALMGLWVGLDYFKDQLGRPLYHRPTGEFTYVTHVEVGNTVELIAADNISSRIYIFEATEEEKKELEQAKGATMQGIPVDGSFNEDDSEREGELEFWTKKEQEK